MVWSEQHIFSIALVFRFCNAFLVRTWFVPDEFYQSLEPAHRMVFGYGHLSWEWEHGLRSYVYPLAFALLFLLLRLLRMDGRFLVISCPRMFQSFLGALGDIHLYKLTKRLYGERVAIWTLASYWLSWFGFFCTPRTLANSTEAVVLLIGLYYYNWPDGYLYKVERRRQKNKRKEDRMYLLMACVSTLIRPTASLLWIPLCLWHLKRVPNKSSFLLEAVVSVGLPAMVVGIYVDRMCYGRWLFSLWNFAEFNVFSGGSSHFGSHPWHWYASQGIPSVLTIHIIPVALGVIKSGKKAIFWLCLWYILFHSILAHKEQRFLLPLVPLLCIFSGVFLADYAADNGKAEKDVRFEDYWKSVRNRAKRALLALAIFNIPIALYTGMIHQLGPMDVTRVIHDEAQTFGNVSVWFLTPCYSAPLYSHVHVQIEIRLLSCQPNLNNSKNYVEEADAFHDNPESWLDLEMPQNYRSRWPSHLILFQDMWTRLEPKLSAKKFAVFKRLFHTHFVQSDRQSSYLVVVKRTE